MSGLEQLESKLTELRSDRDTIANTRTKEDVRSLAESWLTAALGQVNGATNYVLNGHIGPAEVQAVLAEYLLESGALVDFLIGKVEAAAELTNRQRDAKVKKLDEQIAKASQEEREAAKAEAIAAVERQYAGEAA